MLHRKQRISQTAHKAENTVTEIRKSATYNSMEKQSICLFPTVTITLENLKGIKCRAKHSLCRKHF